MNEVKTTLPHAVIIIVFCQQINYMWEDLHREFVSMDPYNTGCISAEEFQEVMTELCVHLTNYELKTLTEKFDLKRDGR